MKCSIGKLLFNGERIPTNEVRTNKRMNDRRNEATYERTNYTQSKTTLKYSLITYLAVNVTVVYSSAERYLSKNKTRTLLELETGTF